jgi:hypothetical protein
MKAKVLGYGEIGKSLVEVYNMSGIDVAWRDIDDRHGDTDCELLNVCIPFSSRFINDVLKQIVISDAKYVVIHSTVPPGITNSIKELSNRIVCHSPVIGIHPNLKESLLTFTKWFGGGCQEILEHFKSLGIKAVLMDDKPESTEIMKLWDTTYYGMCLAINAEANEMLKKYDISYDKWVNYLMEYNIGYEKMNMPNVRRPYFKTLKMPIGGHCIIPNYKVLTTLIDKDLLNLIEKYSAS